MGRLAKRKFQHSPSAGLASLQRRQQTINSPGAERALSLSGSDLLEMGLDHSFLLCPPPFAAVVPLLGI